jgi:serine/threonine protein kinase
MGYAVHVARGGLKMLTFGNGDVIDGKWLVTGTCSDSGGMGGLLFVTQVGGNPSEISVLKYCKLDTPEIRKRFRREVRVMKSFKGSKRVVKIVESNLVGVPPYFVMRYFSKGDLTKLGLPLGSDLAAVEVLFNEMIDCIKELHDKNVFHRDIKPQNFLQNDDRSIIVSDLGLCTEHDSPTGFTRSSQFWGTPGYLPPEFFIPPGFKNADASADVFMLGKTFYALLSNREPMYLLPDGVPAPLFAVIERCCAVHKINRYQSLEALRQGLTAAFDVLLHRVIGSASAIRTLRSIMDRLSKDNKFDILKVRQFVEELDMLPDSDKIAVCYDLPTEMFPILAEDVLATHQSQFLKAYRVLSEHGSYGWSYAEIIADNMKIFMDSPGVAASDKAAALRIAIIGAVRQHRFAAMDTCRTMIQTIIDDDLAGRVSHVLQEFPDTFVSAIEETSCQAPAIRGALVVLKQEEAAKKAAEEDNIPF